jgi:hypothetical protein
MHTTRRQVKDSGFMQTKQGIYKPIWPSLAHYILLMHSQYQTIYGAMTLAVSHKTTLTLAARMCNNPGGDVHPWSVPGWRLTWTVVLKWLRCDQRQSLADVCTKTGWQDVVSSLM